MIVLDNNFSICSRNKSSYFSNGWNKSLAKINRLSKNITGISLSKLNSFLNSSFNVLVNSSWVIDCPLFLIDSLVSSKFQLVAIMIKLFSISFPNNLI